MVKTGLQQQEFHFLPKKMFLLFSRNQKKGEDGSARAPMSKKPETLPGRLAKEGQTSRGPERGRMTLSVSAR